MSHTEAITVTLRPVGSGPPAAVRVRRFLKAALRAYGLRCTRVEPADEISLSTTSNVHASTSMTIKEEAIMVHATIADTINPACANHNRKSADARSGINPTSESSGTPTRARLAANAIGAIAATSEVNQ